MYLRAKSRYVGLLSRDPVLSTSRCYRRASDVGLDELNLDEDFVGTGDPAEGCSAWISEFPGRVDLDPFP
jgi:hypothetical protein